MSREFIVQVMRIKRSLYTKLAEIEQKKLDIQQQHFESNIIGTHAFRCERCKRELTVNPQ